MGWKPYAIALLVFNALGASSSTRCSACRAWLPLNPQQLRACQPGLLVQHRGELRHQHQLAGLRRRVDDELPHADARRSPCRTSSRRRPAWPWLIALIRGFARAHRRKTIGNFWVDLTRITLYMLLPLSLVCALVLVGAGRGPELHAVQGRHHCSSRSAYQQPKIDAAGKPVKDATGQPGDGRRRPPRPRHCRWARPPRRRRSRSSAPTAAASSTPTPRIRSRTRRRSSNFLEMLAILLIPAALCYTFGRMVGDTRQGWAVLAAMT